MSPSNALAWLMRLSPHARAHLAAACHADQLQDRRMVRLITALPAKFQSGAANPAPARLLR